MNTTVNYKQLLHAMKKAEKTRAKVGYTGNPLSNVSMKFKGRFIEFCTTDGNYLCLTKIESEKQIDNIELQFEPTQVLNWLKGLGKVMGNIEIEYETGLKFKYCGSELFVMLANTNYPKYEQLISNYNINNDFRKIGRSKNVQKVCVKTKYLKNILDTIDSDKIEIKFNRDNNLVALELANYENDNEYAMLMPIQTR